jgi:hypothetical protein
MQDEPEEPYDKKRHLEWGVVFSVLASAGSIVFSAGVVWDDLRDHERRLEIQEVKMDGIIPKVERIDANVTFLAEQAREERSAGK